MSKPLSEPILEVKNIDHLLKVPCSRHETTLFMFLWYVLKQAMSVFDGQ
jgi:hypothetical protein